MNEPIDVFGQRSGKIPAGGGDDAAVLRRLLENIARLIDRLHPPGSPDIPPGLSGITARLRRGGEPDTAASTAILGLKEILKEVETLRERATYLDAASAKAFAELNTTEHRLRELDSHIAGIWEVFAHHGPEDLRTVAGDHLADPDRRLAVLRKVFAAEEAGPAADAGDLAGQVAAMKAKAAALRKDHGRTSEDDLRRRHEAEVERLRQEHDQRIAAQREEDLATRTALEADLAAARRALALAESERDRLREATRQIQAREDQAQHLADLEAELDTAREAAARSRDLAAQVTDLEAALAAAQTAAREDRARLSDQRDRLARDLVAAQAQVEDLEQELARSASDRHRSVQEAEALRRTIDEQAAALTANAARIATAAAVSDEAAQAEIQAQAATIATLRGETETLHHQVADLGRQAAAWEGRAHHEARSRGAALLALARSLDHAIDLAEGATVETARRAAERARGAADQDDGADAAAAIDQGHAALVGVIDAARTRLADRNDVARERDRLLGDLGRLEAELGTARAGASGLEQAISGLQTRLAEVEAEHRVLADRAHAAAAERQSHDEVLADLRHQLAAAGERMQMRERELTAARDDLQARFAEVSRRADTDADALARLRELVSSTASILAPHADGAGDLEAAARTVIRRLDDHDQESTTLRADLDRARAALVDLEQAQADLVTRTAGERAGHDDALADLRRQIAASGARIDQLQADLASERDRLTERDRDLASARGDLAARDADLAAEREQVVDLRAQVEAARDLGRRIDLLQADLDRAADQTASDRERVARLLHAVRDLGHAANAAADQAGVGVPAASRLTRTTARIERAESGADLTVAIENACSVCERAAAQCQALAEGVAAERRRRLGLEDDLAQRGAEATDLLARIADLEAGLADLDGLRASHAEILASHDRQQDERQRLDDELAALRQRSEADLRQARAALEAERAAVEAAHGESATLSEELRRARRALAAAEAAAADVDADRLADLEGQVAEARGRADQLAIALEERDQVVDRLQADLDAARAGRGESLGYQARLRALNAKLADTVAELEVVRGERHREAERLQGLSDLEARLAGLDADLTQARQQTRQAQAALTEAEARNADLQRDHDRLAREWKRRLATTEAALAEIRTEATQAANDRAALRGELAALKARRPQLQG